MIALPYITGNVLERSNEYINVLILFYIHTTTENNIEKDVSIQRCKE